MSVFGPRVFEVDDDTPPRVPPRVAPVTVSPVSVSPVSVSPVTAPPQAPAPPRVEPPVPPAAPSDAPASDAWPTSSEQPISSAPVFAATAAAPEPPPSASPRTIAAPPPPPRVPPREEAPSRGGPRVLDSEKTDQIAAADQPSRGTIPTATQYGSTLPRSVPVVVAPPKPSRAISWGLTGVGVAVAGWFVVDAYWWVAAAFERSTVLGAIAATAVVGGVAGAGVIIAREIRSLMALRSVETVRARMAEEVIRPEDARRTIAGILAVVPKERDVAIAIEAYQRQAQPHHNVSQQVAILSRTVMRPLDQRAEAHVRTAVVRAFGITAISPTALSDALFFLACGIRMVRGIAAAYGHRPTAATTAHLLRRLLLEAGKLGAVDIASTTLMQHIGGALTERLATTAADSVYASYRMARLGIMVMDLCRPVPFVADDVPSVSSLVSNAITHRTEGQKS